MTNMYQLPVVANVKTPDSRLLIPEDVKALLKLPMFHGLKKKNIKLPTTVLKAYCNVVADGSVVSDPKKAYDTLITEFNKVMDVGQSAIKRRLVVSARTVNNYQLLFVYFVYPLPHLPGVALSYTTTIYQTTTGEDLYRLSGWGVILEDDIALRNHNKTYSELHNAINVSEGVYETLRNQVLSFDKNSIIRRLDN